MNLNKIEGNTIVVFRNGRDANRFGEKYGDIHKSIFEDWAEMCAYRFVNGECVGHTCFPVECYHIEGDRGWYRSNDKEYKVVYYSEKAVVL